MEGMRRGELREVGGEGKEYEERRARKWGGGDWKGKDEEGSGRKRRKGRTRIEEGRMRRGG